MIATTAAPKELDPNNNEEAALVKGTMGELVGLLGDPVPDADGLDVGDDVDELPEEVGIRTLGG